VNDWLHDAFATAAEALLAERNPGGAWTGELSSSALSTATATIALASVDPARHASLIGAGVDWLIAHRNSDAGWGDTARSRSNLSTTALVWAALAVAPKENKYARIAEETAAWIRGAIAGDAQRAAQRSSVDSLDVAQLIAAIEQRYGNDRTFSIPIIMTLALTGRLGTDGWRRVRPLPFELAAFPAKFFGALRLPVVSYALPALIAIGQVIHHHAPSKNLLVRRIRDAVAVRTLDRLTILQPPNGGFLEATPLTSFVTMSLASMNHGEHLVARRGIEFLGHAIRSDGSYAIDTNLATWLSTQAIVALGADHWSRNGESAQVLRDWLLAQQHRVLHPYTNAAPGGWAWTDLPGGVPDADDTAGALLALRVLGRPWNLDAVSQGIRWLLDLQNSDGGIPTFCKGWGALPFDRSGADLTAHALRAWCAWREDLPLSLQRRVGRAIQTAIGFLTRTQRPGGAWLPLWFGNENVRDETNPAYGTARVLIALHGAASAGIALSPAVTARATKWLIDAQKNDGSWGGDANAPASVEETALAVEALAAFEPRAAEKGGRWLAARVIDGTWREATPIGFYFARLWYFERLYPLIHTAAALRALVIAANRQ
jgi:squalene-hopene/tetraprenyl-beta-curcumene cyclase